MMPESFELPVTWQGEEILLPAEFLNIGYTHRIKVFIDGTSVIFEPDEEKDYRAIIEISNAAIHIQQGLLQAVSETLQELFG
jgi:hypothetical protein